MVRELNTEKRERYFKRHLEAVYVKWRAKHFYGRDCQIRRYCMPDLFLYFPPRSSKK